MRKLLTISIVMLAVCTAAMAQTPEELIAIRDGFAQALDTHNLDALESSFTDDGIFDFVVFPVPIETKENIRAFFADQFAGAPDWHTTEGGVFATDEFVVVDHSAVGTNTGASSTGPPTGKDWVFAHLDIYEFEGDKIKKLTSYGDYAITLVQLGLAPAPEMPELVPSSTLADPVPTGLSPLEANAEAVRSWNNHDLSARMYRTDATIFMGPLGATLDRNAVTALNEMYFNGFSQAMLKPVRTIDLGDGWIVFEHVAFGIHDGPFMGVPASGYPVEVRSVWLTHYDSDGLITQQSVHYDNLTVMTQMTQAPEYLPDGTWVVTAPTPFGDITFLHTVSSQGKMGGPFAGSMIQVNKNPTFFGMFPEADSASNWLTKTMWTGRNRVESMMLMYGTKIAEGPLFETVYIIISRSMWTLTGPNTNEGTAMVSVYLADQDADGDGFPDPGEEPMDCLPFTFSSRRLNMMPPCVPPPVAE
ncbi:ester cyclase [Planctomycetota bacterium]